MQQTEHDNKSEIREKKEKKEKKNTHSKIKT